MNEIDRVLATLCRSVRNLEFGDLVPDEIVHTGTLIQFRLNSQEQSLLAAIVEHGTPSVIKVADSRPIWGEFGIKTEVGLAKKRISFK